MSNPFIGQIMLFAGNFAPSGWALCNGQILSIQQNTALFSILGTTYGGNGTTNFGLPDLRGRVPVSQGQGPGLSNYVLGEQTGQETVTLTTQQMPVHTHSSTATLTADASPGSTTAPANANIAQVTLDSTARPPKLASSFTPGSPANPVHLGGVAVTVGNAGNSQPHTNIQPTLALNYIIALVGIYPARN